MRWGPGILVSLALLILVTNLGAIATDTDAWWDMKVLFSIVQDWWEGEQDLFPTADVLNSANAESYRYPPVWGMAILPLARSFELRAAISVWAAFSLVAFFGGLLLLVRQLQIPLLSSAGASICLLLALHAPVYETFYGPTKEMVMVGLMAVTFVLVERRRLTFAGATFAAAILHKIYPIFIGGYYLLKREFRLLGLTAGWLLLLNVAPMAIIGADETLDFYLRVLPATGGADAAAMSYLTVNAGFDTLLIAFNWLNWFHHGVDPLGFGSFAAAPALAWRLLVAIVLVVTSWTLERSGRLSDAFTRFRLFGAWTASILVTIPVAWVNYQIFLVFPLIVPAVWLYRRSRLTALHLAATALLAVSFLCMSTPVKYAHIHRYIDPGIKFSELLATTIGGELEQEFWRRVEYRSWQIDRLPTRPAVRGVAAHRILVAQGVDHGGSRGPDHATLQSHHERLRATTNSSEKSIARLAARVRATNLTTHQVIGLAVIRPLAGVLAWIGALLACFAQARSRA